MKKKILNDNVIQLDGYDHKVFEMCRKLSRKIVNQRSKRQKNTNLSSKINFSRTIRTNLKNGGHFINLIHKKPPIHKNNHIFSCDVSGSCEWIATWFFAIIYGCQQTFNKIKIYDFDNKLIDVSDTLEAKSYESASQISSAHRSKGVLTFGQSDMTNSFKEFLDTAEINN